MGRSWYLAKSEADFYAGSNTFSTLISAGATSYGLTTSQATAYAALNATYSAAFLLAQAPQTRTKGTIQARRDAKVPLLQMASELAKIIEAAPAVTNQQKVDLGLNVRATPSPSPAPGTCNDFKAKLLGDGSIESTWKANNPTGMSGVTYEIWRRLGSTGEFSFLGGSGQKKFVDATIPGGTAEVQYKIRGIRPTGAGAWAQFVVNLGQAAGGATTFASVVQSPTGPKMAA